LIWLLRDFDLLSVLLRALTLGLEMLTLGGVAFILLAAIPGLAGPTTLQACWRGLRWAAICLALTELAYVSVDSAILMGSSSLRFNELLLAPYFVAGVAAIFAAASLAFCTRLQGAWSKYALLPCGLVILLAVVYTSHSVSRMEDRVVLAVLTGTHQLGASIWIGAMPFLLISLKRAADPGEAKHLLRRYSPMAVAGAIMLLLGGVGMAWFYLGISQDRSLSGLYGTAYGVMLLSKIYLVALVMAMGAGNYFLVRRIETAPLDLLSRLRRFGEVEIGLGFMAVLAAASMTSQPPAVDMPHDRVSIAEIVARFHPVAPRMTSPAYAALAPSTPLEVSVKETQFTGATAPSDANDEAWSEYNHHWSGVIVFAAGLFALISRLPSKYGLNFRWALNWPIAFVGLAVFIVLRADPDCWPLGPRPFWASMYAPDVLQHRLYAVLICAFAAFEWGIQTGRLHSRWAASVFPVLCAAGGALLLTHNHSIGNVKEELLAEMSHTPIALLGATAGCSRWLELRLPDEKESRFASFVWPISLMLVGLVLLNYRES
jgi:putative copper resistance protein D